MLSIAEYFDRFLGYGMSMISNNNLTPQTQYFETYKNLDDKLLQLHAEYDKDPGAMEELGERYYLINHDINSAIPYLEQASQLGNGEASAVLSQIYRTSWKNWDKYFHYVQLSAEQGCVIGLFNLSCCYFKGKKAYEGHGFDEDKQKALELSIAASHRARELIHFIFTNRCSNGFQEYLNRLVSVFLNSTCAAAEQLIYGDGVQKQLPEAKLLLTESNEFIKVHFGCEAPDFTELLKLI